MTAPKISFVIINHNYGQYVGQAISSVLSQDYAEFECVVLDNASTDSSRDAIRQFENADNRLRIEYLDRNLNQMGGFLHVIDRLSGELVCIVDADDFLFANFAAFHVQLHLDCGERIAVTSGGVCEVDGTGAMLTPSYAFFLHSKAGTAMCPGDAEGVPRLLSQSDRELLWRQSTLIAPHEHGWHWSPGTANMYKLSFLKRARPMLNVVNSTSTDNYFMPFLSALSGSACIDIPLSAYRIHGRNRYSVIPAGPGLRPTSKQSAARTYADRKAMVRTLASRARDFVSTHAETFWMIMDAAPVPDGVSRHDYFNDPVVQDILREHFDELVAACGKTQTSKALRARMGRKSHDVFMARVRDGNAPANRTAP
ncbi:glycosyltransferase family A protein [Mesorhizobium sp. B2-6-2]|uniref:glycosyltransferase family 2 protein n=1 Tax=Mesorhizobium sp. B2-6-2 TaxID=2589915 RepID=UPI00112C975C|nr:glycosyltransferase family A protein [Mesorhizobium sp. B2-6-2]TPJ75883.1 glycosyltransferase family 2 protein [Mesorhizobium sp. B2-6-2]